MIPVIFGIAGTSLTAEEIDLFQNIPPLGVILFSRNIEDSKQLKELCRQIRQLNPISGNKGKISRPLILIDQEGGKVQRLRPPLFPDWPSAATFSKLYDENPEAGMQACYQSNLQMAMMLEDMGINVNCTPVLDLGLEGAHDIIGSRAYGNNPIKIAQLGQTVMQAHLKAKVIPVMKHIPGHGRAMVDSHLELPMVEASKEILIAQDFDCFKRICKAFDGVSDPFPYPFFAMTAHIIYPELDKNLPATLSKTIIQDWIRGHIGFQGLLMSDDIGMKALKGNAKDLSLAILKAGCDVVLHCNGNFQEMEEIAHHIQKFNPAFRPEIEKIFL